MARRRAPAQSANIWPGFVDGLATLLLVMMFVLSIFVVAQFYLGEQLTAKDQLLSEQDDALSRLRAQLADLANDLSLAKAESAKLQTDNDALSLQIDVLQDTISDKDSQLAAIGAAVAASAEELEAERALSDDQKAEIATLNAQLAALRRQLTSIQEALEAAEAKDLEQQAQIENLSSRLNAALARKVQELAEVRSRFFEALRDALGDRDDVKVVGDRFVFESDILFGSCSATISPAGRGELSKFAQVLLDIRGQIPSQVAWVLRVDGHADQTPLGPSCQAKFESNWHLSSARAISVVQFLQSEGVPARRLVAAGFGEHQPLVAGRDTLSLTQNRRIEFKLTER